VFGTGVNHFGDWILGRIGTSLLDAYQDCLVDASTRVNAGCDLEMGWLTNYVN